MDTDLCGKGKVAVVRTRPETVLEDCAHLMALAGFEKALPKSAEVVLKMNVSWQTWYPSCSTTPWQLEGVIRTLQKAGYQKLLGAHNDTVVVDVRDGELNNKLRFITDKYQVPCAYLFENQFEWITYQPREPLLVLDKVFPDGVRIPKILVGKNIVHLPTIKTHVFTTITGAMKNAFGGLLHRHRHWTHSVIHETLVDLLQIQQDIHPGIFAVMDGTFAGDGPGPRAMRWHEKNIMLASSDQVAIDAISARLQGFDPMSIKFLRLAHEKGLGIADPRDIEILGYDIAREPAWNFVQEDTLASRGQKAIYYGPLKPFEKILLRSPLVPWSYFASNFYHNVYWYPFVGRPRVEAALKTQWGKLFKEYGDGRVVMPGMERKTIAVASLLAFIALALVSILTWTLMR
jgi:uncharacterized protein (DUF362 family)